MNEIIEKKELKEDNMIYAIRRKQVMLDSKISRTKCYNYFYDMMIAHYDIDGPISVLLKCVDAKFGKEINIW